MANPPHNDNTPKPELAQEQDISTKGLDLFFGEKERAFFDLVGREITNDILKESFILYRIDLEKTKTHKLYGESKNKVYKTPVEIFGRINIEVGDPEFMTPGGITKKGFGKITADIFRSYLTELNVNIKNGDYMYFRGHYYEVVNDGSSNIANEQAYAGDIVFSIKIIGIRVKNDVFNAR
jgi:hypothetical protein